MTYEEFKDLWTWTVRESGLLIMGARAVEESLDLVSTDRRCKTYVQPPSNEKAAAFHVTASLEFRWDALQVARTVTTEEDMLHRLFGDDRARTPRTEVPWLRVDLTLHASTAWGKEIAFPSNHVWRSWARETVARLEYVEPLLPLEQVREHRSGMLDILAWRSDPELNVLCKPDGTLLLRGVEVAAWQAINLPRKWDDPDRKADQGPHDQLAALLRRLKASLHGWMEALAIIGAAADNRIEQL